MLFLEHKTLICQPVSIGEIFKAMETAGGFISKNQKANDTQPFNQLNEHYRLLPCFLTY